MGWVFDNDICSYQKICSKFHTTPKNWLWGTICSEPDDVILALDMSFTLISFNRIEIQMYFTLTGLNI